MYFSILCSSGKKHVSDTSSRRVSRAGGAEEGGGGGGVCGGPHVLR